MTRQTITLLFTLFSFGPIQSTASTTCIDSPSRFLPKPALVVPRRPILRHPTDIPVSSLSFRGGFQDSSDEYDEYDDDDDEDIDQAQQDEAASAHKTRKGQQIPRPVVDDRGRTRAPYLPRKKKQKNVISQMASTSLNLSKKAALTTVQTSGKAAFYLMRPKSIQRKEIFGVWRLDQQVGMQQAFANLELTPRGLVIIRDDSGIVWKSPYTFTQPTWPKSCRVEFEAKAFQPKGQKKARLLFYKGYLERKVADKRVIKMVGKLYEIERPKSMFGKNLPPKYTQIGSFVGRKRVVLVEEEEEEDEYDEEVDEEEEEEDERILPPRRGRRPAKKEDFPEDEYDDYYDEEEL